MKAIGYIRVSTKGQVEDGVSVEAQGAKINAWAELNGVETVIFRDEGVSGKRADNRPGLAAALEQAEPGDALVVYSLSRLSRSTRDTLALAETLAGKKVDFVSLSERIDTTTAAGKMVFRMLAVLSEFERDQVSDRTRFALAHKKANGEKTGGDVPYGYRVEEGHLYPFPDEQKIIRQAKRMSRQGMSLRNIARKLEQSGKTPRTGGSWQAKTIARMIAGDARPVASVV